MISSLYGGKCESLSLLPLLPLPLYVWVHIAVMTCHKWKLLYHLVLPECHIAMLLLLHTLYHYIPHATISKLTHTKIVYHRKLACTPKEQHAVIRNLKSTLLQGIARHYPCSHCFSPFF